MTPHIKYQRLTEAARIPVQATPGSTGLDLYSAEDYVLDIGERRAIGTGLIFDMRHIGDIDIQIRSRSGLAINHGVVVLNAPGTIDKDYRGEIKVILINHGDFPYMIKAGDRIAQLVFGYRVPNIMMVPIDVVEQDTKRGAGGFNSTGT